MKMRMVIIFCLCGWGRAYAQSSAVKQDIIGTYTLVLVDNIKADGGRIHLYGDAPQGILMLDRSGNYSLQIVSANRPRFAAGDKSKGTDEENKLAVAGSNAHFGTYTIDGVKHTITFNIDHASFPNWEGTKQVRPFEFDGAMLKYSVPAPTTGGAVTGEVSWRKE